jgi:hypothetical protein
MKKLAPLLLVLLSNTAPQAVDQGITYDCDTATGHFSSLVLPVPRGGFTVEGKVQLREIADIGKWAPGTRVTIVGGVAEAGNVPAEGAGFLLAALPAKLIDKRAGKGIVQYLQWQENHAGNQTMSEPFAIRPAKEELPFSVRYDGKVVTMTMGGAQTSVTLMQPASAVRIICSTGEFLYTDLKITPAGQ